MPYQITVTGTNAFGDNWVDHLCNSGRTYACYREVAPHLRVFQSRNPGRRLTYRARWMED